MVEIDDIARAALEGNALQVRSLVQDFVAQPRDLHATPRPETDDHRVLAAAASILELLCSRQGAKPPAWTTSIGPLAEPHFLVRSAATMKRLRELCEREGPAPLRRRKLYAPPDYLTMA
jgi:hypothetical protein